MIELNNKVLQLKSEKRTIYDSYFGNKEEEVEVYDISNHQQIVGVDPGRVDLVISVELDYATALTISLHNWNENLQKRMEEKVSSFLRTKANIVKTSKIHTSSTLFARKKKLNFFLKKHQYIRSTEDELKQLKRVYIANKEGIKHRYSLYRKNQPSMVKFYKKSSWSKKFTAMTRKFTRRSYSKTSNALLWSDNKATKKCFFVGNAGGFANSRIKKHERGSHAKIKKELAHKATVIETEEFRTLSCVVFALKERHI